MQSRIASASLMLSICALLLSICALVVSASAYRCAEERVEQAWMRREQNIVRKHAPQFKKLYAEFGLPEAQSWEPKTMEALLDPLVKVIDGLSR